MAGALFFTTGIAILSCFRHTRYKLSFENGTKVLYTQELTIN